MTQPQRVTNDSKSPKPTVRVAIYTRKSVDDGLDNEFNSLDAQRASALHYIASQRHLGWVAIETRYDDGGFTGANTDRPALKRLLDDIQRGLVDFVAVYKIDRLSRRQLDLLSLIDLFVNSNVGFVSVTQAFDTSTPMGRCMLQIMGSFAELERAQISERTSDMMSACRRRGQWTGGTPPLGYDSVNAKLVVNPSESRQVLGTFELYETLRSYPATCKELALRGWRTKSWVNKNGRLVLSKPYTKTLLSSLLHNPLYAGKTQLRGEIFDGQHEAIVDVDLWSKVQEILADKNHLTPGKERNKYVVMLHQRVYCARCGTRMNYKPSTDADTGRTNFYLSCQTYQKKRSDACPGSHIRASIVEEFVVSRIRRLGENPTVTRESFAAALDALRTQPDKVKTVLQDVANELERLTAQRLDIVTIDEKEQPDVKTRLEGIDRQIAAVQQRAAELRQDLEALNHDDVDAEDHRQAFAAFTPIWDHLRAEEKMRVLALLIERVAVDVLGNRIDITFRDNGLPEIESPSAA